MLILATYHKFKQKYAFTSPTVQSNSKDRKREFSSRDKITANGEMGRPFIYREGVSVPKSVTHVEIDPKTRRIEQNAFKIVKVSMK